jgi:hypothetical protein
MEPACHERDEVSASTSQGRATGPQLSLLVMSGMTCTSFFE